MQSNCVKCKLDSIFHIEINEYDLTNGLESNKMVSGSVK